MLKPIPNYLILNEKAGVGKTYLACATVLLMLDYYHSRISTLKRDSQLEKADASGIRR